MKTRFKFFFAVVLTLAPLAEAWAGIDWDGYKARLRLLPGYDLKFERPFCETKFPYARFIPRTVDPSGNYFELMAYTVKPFDASKPSALYIDGGPGGIGWMKDSQKVAEKFPQYNFVFFHARGAGCSGFPQSDLIWDQYLTGNAIVGDMEAIRAEYKVERWALVFGSSYGTYLGRRYANKFGDRMAHLLLEGVTGLEASSTGRASTIIMQTVRNRMAKSPLIQSVMTPTQMYLFQKKLERYYLYFSPNQNYSLATYGPFAEEISKKLTGYLTPTDAKNALKRTTYLATIQLLYGGDIPANDLTVLMLAHNFGVIILPGETLAQAESAAAAKEAYLFPYLNPNFVADVDSEAPPSMNTRVLHATMKNDATDPDRSLCSDVVTTIVHGNQDLATPVENTYRFIADKKCARGDIKALIVEGGGHHVMSHACVVRFVQARLEGRAADLVAIAPCDVGVQFR